MPLENNEFTIGNEELGFVFFTGFEIPEKLSLGGEQRTVKSEYVGYYKRELQTLGAQPREIEWSGVFLYSTALARARALEGMMEAGARVKLTWGEVKREGVITKFYYDVQQKNHIIYTLTFEVILRKDAQRDAGTIPDSKDYISSTLIQNVIGTITTLLVDIQRVEAILDDISRGDVNALMTALVNATAIIGSVPGGIANLDSSSVNQVFNLISLASLTAQGLAERVQAYSSSPEYQGFPFDSIQHCIASLQILAEMINRYRVPPAASATPILNENVFRLSLQTYGTIDKWDAIMTQNKLDKIRISGGKVIQFPAVSGPQTNQSQTTYDAALPITTRG